MHLSVLAIYGAFLNKLNHLPILPNAKQKHLINLQSNSEHLERARLLLERDIVALERQELARHELLDRVARAVAIVKDGERGTVRLVLRERQVRRQVLVTRSHLELIVLRLLTLPVQDEELLLRKVALVRLRAELARVGRQALLARSEAEVAVLGQVTAHSLEARLLEERLLLLLVPYGILGKLVSVEVKSSAFTRLLSCSRRHD